MNRDQFKHLKQRVSDLHRDKAWSIKDAPMPSAVKKAKATVKAWESDQMEERERRRERLTAAHSKAYNAILFEDDPQQALAALQEFERFKP